MSVPHNSTTRTLSSYHQTLQTPHQPSRRQNSQSSSTQHTHQSANSNNPSLTASQTHRNRQYTHLHAQLAQLNAHLADTENLLGMTAVQAEYVRGLGGCWGGLFMASSRVLGEEVVGGAAGGDKGKGA